MTNPNEPTLTCSEVVERLHEAHIMNRNESFRLQAERILHSWRERRVRELEGVLIEIIKPRGEFCHICGGGKVGFSGHAMKGTQRCPIAVAEDALANSEWREQIRKGAKHESDL